MAFTDEQRAALQEPPDNAELMPNAWGGQYLKAERVFAKLDALFGAGNWWFEPQSHKLESNRFALADARLVITDDAGAIVWQGVGSGAIDLNDCTGYNKQTGKRELRRNAIQLAYVGAMTYAQRDAAKPLGPAFGRDLDLGLDANAPRGAAAGRQAQPQRQGQVSEAWQQRQADAKRKAQQRQAPYGDYDDEPPWEDDGRGEGGYHGGAAAQPPTAAHLCPECDQPTDIGKDGKPYAMHWDCMPDCPQCGKGKLGLRDDGAFWDVCYNCSRQAA